jgi:uncharacterized protein (TIGR02118 family)
MIKRVFAFRYAEGQPLDLMEDWYLDRHTQLAKQMPGIVRYVTYKSIPETGMDLFAAPQFYRWTEIWWENMESLREALSSPQREATLMDNLLPDGSSKFSFFRSAVVGQGTDILHPERNIVDDSPHRGKPAVKALFLFNYAEDLTLEEAEAWYSGQHTQIAKQMPGLMHYVTYRSLQSPAEPDPGFFRLTELWWEDIKSAEAGLNSPQGMKAAKDNIGPGRSIKLNASTSFHQGPVLVGFPIDII